MNNIATFFRESRIARFFIPLGIVLIVFSVFLFISDNQNKDYIKTESTVSKTELVKEATYDNEGNKEEATYRIFVKYTVDGKEYEQELGEMFERTVGDKVTIVYDPSDPTKISQPSSPILNFALLIGGIAALVGGVLSVVNAVKRHKKMKEQEESWKNGE